MTSTQPNCYFSCSGDEMQKYEREKQVDVKFATITFLSNFAIQIYFSALKKLFKIYYVIDVKKKLANYNL